MMRCFDRVTLRSHFVQPLILALSWLLLMSPTLGSAPGPAPAQDGIRAKPTEPGPQTASPRSPQPPDLFLKLRSELIVLPISVADSLGRFITGLRRDHFEIDEQDVPQSVRFFSTEDVPISVGVILDTSGSMKRKIARAREAVRRFIEWSNQQDEFFFITFNHHVTLQADFSDGEVLVNYLPFLEAKGRTALYDAIYEGVRKLSRGRYGKRVLLVVSDGQDNSSRYGFRSLSRLMKESDVQIYTIGTPDPTRSDDYFERQGIDILQHISKLTGGRQFTVLAASGLEPVCIYIANELRRQYTIGYMSSNPARDGTWRKIKVRVAKEVGFKITKHGLEKLKSEGVPDDVLARLESLKDQKVKVRGQGEFLDILKTVIGDEQAVKFNSLVWKHAQKQEGEKLRVHTKGGYYAPLAQPEAIP